MKVLVVGLGSIGKRHIQNIKKIDPSIKIFVWRQASKETDIGVSRSFVEDIFFEKKQALACQPDITLVTNPAPFHLGVAIDFLIHGSHVFIEKPLSISLKDTDRLLKVCKDQKKVLMIGYVLRFCEPLNVIKKALSEKKIGHVLSAHASVGSYLPDWRPNTDYRNAVSAKHSLSGGILFELSHEIDYLSWFLGEVDSVSAQLSKMSNLEIDVHDTAKLILKFKTGSLASIHMDMVDHAHHRSCRMIGSEGTLVWSSEDNNCVKSFDGKKKQWEILYQDSEEDKNAMYLKELKHFLMCIDSGCSPLVDGRSGRRILEISLAAELSAKEGRVVQV